MGPDKQSGLAARTQHQQSILIFHASTKERIAALNLSNVASPDGYVRGRIIPVNGIKQSWVSWSVAICTLCLFISWPYLMAALFISSMPLLASSHLLVGHVRGWQRVVGKHQDVL